MACGFSGRDAMEQHDVQELCWETQRQWKDTCLISESLLCH